MHGIKVFFKLMIGLIAPKGPSKEKHNLLGFTVSVVPSPKVNLPVLVLHSAQWYCNNLDKGPLGRQAGVGVILGMGDRDKQENKT